MNTPHTTKAQHLLKAVDVKAYAATRNHIGHGTGMSPYVTRGVLTLPGIMRHILMTSTKAQAYTLIFELAWREYWQREWLVGGSAIFEDMKRPQAGIESLHIPTVVYEARTGIEALDAGTNELYETGYIHNHMRMWLAGLVCSVAHTYWKEPAAWMYYYLLDGDPASNFLSWQWVAGTNSSKQYLPAQDNINTYAKSSQKGTFLDEPYEYLAVMPTPHILEHRTPLSLSWKRPVGDTLHIDASKPTILYHSFWLNREWHQDEDVNRILVLEPSWFEAFPVSEKVTQFIVEVAREIPGMQVYVGEIAELMPRLGSSVIHMNHPSVKHWPSVGEDMPLLFPDVPLRSYCSFMSFWKKCEKYL